MCRTYGHLRLLDGYSKQLCQLLLALCLCGLLVLSTPEP